MRSSTRLVSHASTSFPHTPEPIVESCAARVEPDSLRAVFVDHVFRLPKPARVKAPILVLGGEDDGTISNDACVQTQAQLFPNTGHNMMLERGWSDVADRIYFWLGGQAL
jgi:pimeloyl-ACP methyl ester carboxylesterase